MVRRREDLTTPRRGRRLEVTYDEDAFGRFSESIARVFGTARFLAIQTAIVFFWITLNVVAVSLQWDPYPFILLNLAFSTQAAYAAPLILLAQTRQAERDKAHLELVERRHDELERAATARTQAIRSETDKLTQLLESNTDL